MRTSAELPELVTCDHQSDAQPRCSRKLRSAAGLEEEGGVENEELVVLQNAQKTQEVPTTTQKKTERMGTLSREQASDLTAPGNTRDIILTLEKENSPNDWLSQSLDQERPLSSPVINPPSTSASLTQDLSDKQQNQESRVQDWSDLQYAEDGGSLSPDRGDDEGPPPSPPTNTRISLRKSKSRVKAQSKRKDLVQMNGSDTKTGESTYLGYDNQGFEFSDDKKPIIVILNEAMDIQSAYKRLSTIFESEEDLAGILTPESIVHEEKMKQEEEEPGLRKLGTTEMKPQRPGTGSAPENQNQNKSDSPKKTETKRKFKFRFPKNKLAAISQAIRTGTKTGKKTLEVVVYEEVEEPTSDSRLAKETENQTKESKVYEISRAKHFDFGESNSYDGEAKVSSPRLSTSYSRVEELCKTTLDSVGSLEESIKQLEISVSNISPSSSLQSSPPQSPDSASADRTQHKGKVKRERERSPPKGPAPQILKGSNPPQSKKAKPQPPHDTGKPSSKKQV